jgi:hypothetical protein
MAILGRRRDSPDRRDSARPRVTALACAHAAWRRQEKVRSRPIPRPISSAARLIRARSELRTPQRCRTRPAGRRGGGASAERTPRRSSRSGARPAGAPEASSASIRTGSGPAGRETRRRCSADRRRRDGLGSGLRRLNSIRVARMTRMPKRFPAAFYSDGCPPDCAESAPARRIRTEPPNTNQTKQNIMRRQTNGAASKRRAWRAVVATRMPVRPAIPSSTFAVPEGHRPGCGAMQEIVARQPRESMRPGGGQASSPQVSQAGGRWPLRMRNLCSILDRLILFRPLRPKSEGGCGHIRCGSRALVQ